MSNTEWKKGYEEGFAAGWKAAKEQSGLNHKNYPPVYYGGSAYTVKPTDTVSITGVGGYSVNDYSPATMAEMPGSSNIYGVKTVLLNEKKINNLTDHTRIV